MLRIKLCFKEFILLNLIYSSLSSVLILIFTYFSGIEGYFHSQWVAGSLATMLFMPKIVKLYKFNLKMINLERILKTMKELWGISWFIYGYKLSGQAARRLPIVLGGSFLSPSSIGVVTISIDLATKISMINQAIAPLISVTLAKCFRNSISEFRSAARKELISLTIYNIFGILVFVLLWEKIGSFLFGFERWTSVGNYIYLGLLIEACSIYVFICNLCVIIPANKTENLIYYFIIINMGLSFSILILRYFISIQESLLMICIMTPAIILSIIYTDKMLKIFSYLKNYSQ